MALSRTRFFSVGMILSSTIVALVALARWATEPIAAAFAAMREVIATPTAEAFRLQHEHRDDLAGERAFVASSRARTFAFLARAKDRLAPRSSLMSFGAPAYAASL